MNLLLDTHVLLWALDDDTRLSDEAHHAITAGRNRVLVSAVSAWEITVKKALGKLRAPADLVDQLERLRFTPLDVTVPHALAVGELPEHHTDPFDRLLVAQARTESLTLVSRDPQLQRYEVDVLVA
ncbi:MAG: type II toxin-antitoxin system VapC family toxin [Actinobacteria bacterium]|nr:type II toxin-antitoxin system VapC family toxin [Actinomycetota bacterium]